MAVGAGAGRTHKPFAGVWTGALAGLVMGLFTMVVAAPVLKLPWYSPPRVLATMAMGRGALDNILEFRLAPFVVGVVLLLILAVILGALFTFVLRAANQVRIVGGGVLYGLFVWAVLQYFLLPLLFPLVTDKGFPPEWYAASFGVFGLTLGALPAFGISRRS